MSSSKKKRKMFKNMLGRRKKFKQERKKETKRT